MVVRARKRTDYRVLAIDLGNGAVKIRALDLGTGEIYLIVLPSAWAYKRDAGKAIHNKKYKLEVFEIDGEEYVWGEDIWKAVDADKLKTVGGHDGRYEQQAYKIMAKIAMAKAVNDLDIEPTEKIYLSTGVPSKEAGTKKEQEVVKAFLSEEESEIHQVTVNGNERFFRVVHVEIMSQPVASVIARYLDEDGYIADEDYEEMKVAVVDIGGGTTDFDIVQNLSRLDEISASIKKGFNDVYDYIRKAIIDEYPTHEVSDFKLFHSLKDKMYTPNLREEPIDISDAFEKGVTDLAISIETTATRHWKDQSGIDEILIVGGSAEEFEGRVSSVIKDAIIPDNPQTSNVEGYYRWAMLQVMLLKKKLKEQKVGE